MFLFGNKRTKLLPIATNYPLSILRQKESLLKKQLLVLNLFSKKYFRKILIVKLL